MYLKFELPGGHFRIFENVTDLILPKGNNRVSFKNTTPDGDAYGKIDSDEAIEVHKKTVEGICWVDLVKALPEETQFQVSHLFGMPGVKCVKDPEYVEFVVIDRPRMAYHAPVMFLDKNKVPTIVATQWSVFVCNDNGKTIETIK